MSELNAVYRILDASANRAAEGLRTMEEYARFGLDDSRLAGELKSFRHRLAASLGSFSREQLLDSRDTTADVGTELREPSEYTRVEIIDVIRAASSRVQQSLRSLEEYGKMIDAGAAKEFEQMRYQAYTVAAELEVFALRSERRKLLEQSRLYALIDAAENQEAFALRVSRLVQSEVDVLQLRDRSVDDRTLISRARIGSQLAREHGKLFIMNDRADLALAADTDGVHVGQEELPARDARKIVGAKKLVGVSTHSVSQARAAAEQGADYIGCGPVFAGNTKKFDSYVGTDLVTKVAAEITIPAFAIGGIDLENVDEVVAAGMRRIAVTGVIRDSSDPVSTAAELKARLVDRASLPSSH